eukprot:TRINITY_DN9074_c0_g1_i1.p1 TRINITY_DN9074_c0_g1~~TRINITY_DN9074_c0_g1_i1.p1  ORF type:complete len:202 (-),score=26.28 TRINITY_DN9074_c0_g1_i1:128-733(-)
MNSQQNYDYLFKLVLVGDSGVGKSSVLARFTDNIFVGANLCTIGVDFKVKSVDIAGARVKLQIWDTAGQERFRTISNAYYRGAQGIVFLFDLTSRRSLQSIDDWLARVNLPNTQDVVKILIGNKSDLVEKREVSFDEVAAYAEAYGMSYFETSASSGINIDRAFHTAATEIKEKVDNGILAYQKPILPQNAAVPQKKSSCC